MFNLKGNILLNMKRVYSLYNYTLLKDVTNSAPLYINVDVTNACNYKCPMCPQANPQSKVKRGFIETELFNKIVSDIKKFMPIETLCLFLAGEPLLDKNLEKYIAMVKGKLGIRPHIASNISHLTLERSHALIEAGLGSILVDFCADQAIFERLRKRASWTDTYENLKLLVAVKKNLKSIYPRIILKDVSTGTADPIADQQRIKNLKSLFGDGEISRFQKYKFHNWGGLNQATEGKEKSLDAYHPCSHLWFNMSIQYDGRVSACCRDAEGKLIMGNVREKSLKEIWNDKSIVGLRRALIRKEYQNIPLCNNCDRLWTGGYFGGSPVKILKRFLRTQPAGFKVSLNIKKK
jgi:radical SAM protein with 4Fe4S-binding SPASM domain